MKTRSDGWLPYEDARLAEIVIEYIRTGKTQLQAFDAIAEVVGRTSAACGFRWNSQVRKQFEDSIKQAKKERKTATMHKTVSVKAVEEESQPSSFAIEDVIRLLTDMKREYKIMESEVHRLKKILQENNEEMHALKTQNEELIKKMNTDQTISSDYQELLKIIERARQMKLIEDTDLDQKFTMDVNGNLERIAT